MRAIHARIGVPQAAATAQVVTYAKPSGAPDAVWQTTVAGAATWTHYTTRGATATYSTDAAGPVAVTMAAPVTVTAVQVEVQQDGVAPRNRPTIAASFVGTLVSFTLPTGFFGSVMVRINNAVPSADWQRFCYLHVRPLETDIPAQGAVTYYFGPGLHTGAAISLASNSTVYIAGGALVKRRIVAGTVGGNSYSQRSNIRLWGRGVLDTSNGYGPLDQGLGAGDFAGVNGLTFEGFTYVSRWSWAIALYKCTNPVLDRMAVFSCEIPDAPDYTGQGTPDGVDPVACNGFTFKRGFISASDDSSALKSNKYGEVGNANDHLWEDVLLVQGGKSNAMDIGYELGTSTITNITYRRVYAPICWRDQQPFRTNTFGIHVITVATVDGVLFEDCMADEARAKDYDLFVSSFYYGGGLGSVSGDANRGYIRNVTYRRCDFPDNSTVRITSDLTDPNYESGSKKIINLTFDQCTRGGVALTAPQADWTVANVTNLVFT